MEVLDRLVARLVALCLALAVLAVGLATAFGFLVAGSYMLLSQDLPGWAAALIVGGALAVLAPLVALALIASGRARRLPPGAVPPGAVPPGMTAAEAALYGRTGAGAADIGAAAARLQTALRRSPWSLVAGALAAGVVLGMSREARRSGADLLAALLRPPPRL